ncbi:MAG: DUF721 domain-containing protein [Treponema sp.]|nr:DUF721 domain-containing protein [Treponema sp.]
MKRAGDLLSTIIDEKMMGKAREYSRLFSTWEYLTKKHQIAAAANHSRIQDLKLGILLVEADHPGWIQILQTRENLLLVDLQESFPDLDISGIAFKMGKSPWVPGEAEKGGGEYSAEEGKIDRKPPVVYNESQEATFGYDGIKNDELKDVLKSLKKNIAQRDKGGSKTPA